MTEKAQTKNQKDNRLAYKIAEVAEMLGISDSSVRRMIGNGTLKSIGKLRHILIPRSEIDRLLEV